MVKKVIIWPPNIDSQKARSHGRKISEKYAVPSPTLSEIKKAAMQLDLNPEVEKSKAYPKEWWSVSGRVLVDKTKPKSILFREIVAEIKKIRGEK